MLFEDLCLNNVLIWTNDYGVDSIVITISTMTLQYVLSLNVTRFQSMFVAKIKYLKYHVHYMTRMRCKNPLHFYYFRFDHGCLKTVIQIGINQILSLLP